VQPRQVPGRALDLQPHPAEGERRRRFLAVEQPFEQVQLEAGLGGHRGHPTLALDPERVHRLGGRESRAGRGIRLLQPLAGLEDRLAVPRHADRPVESLGEHLQLVARIGLGVGPGHDHEPQAGQHRGHPEQELGAPVSHRDSPATAQA
jgi:hypothetical protein